MAIKTILSVTGTDHDNGDLKDAAALCEEVGAHLSVLVVLPAASPPVGEYAAVVSDAWLLERQEDAKAIDARVKMVSAFLADHGISADVTGEYPELAWTDQAIGRRARYADITVLGPELLESEVLRDKAVEGALFSSGRPLLLVRRGMHASLKPKRVTVAWDASIEASQAVHGAIDLLAAAQEVRLAIVDPVEGEWGQGAEPGADVATYLARHGAKVTVDALPSQGRSIADVLCRHATDASADMIVMGAYGQSRLREWIFGGVTHSMLAAAPVPLFLAH